MASSTYLSQTWVLKHFLCSRKGHGSVTFPSRLWCPGNFLRHKNTCGFASSCLLWANILCFLFFKANACIFTDFKPLSPCCTAKLPQKAARQRIRPQGVFILSFRTGIAAACLWGESLSWPMGHLISSFSQNVYVSVSCMSCVELWICWDQ